jgi:hypothetical protein
MFEHHFSASSRSRKGFGGAPPAHGVGTAHSRLNWIYLAAARQIRLPASSVTRTLPLGALAFHVGGRPTVL